MAHERSKLEDDQREMSKAFARSADDAEINDQLKVIKIWKIRNVRLG